MTSAPTFLRRKQSTWFCKTIHNKKSVIFETQNRHCVEYKLSFKFNKVVEGLVFNTSNISELAEGLPIFIKSASSGIKLGCFEIFAKNLRTHPLYMHRLLKRYTCHLLTQQMCLQPSNDWRNNQFPTRRQTSISPPINIPTVA